MKFYKRTRMSYWCHSKLFSWMLPEESNEPFTFEKLKEQIDSRINPTPKLERFIDKLQDIIIFPSDLVYSIKIYFKNSKGNTHVLDGGLEKGQWYDLTYRIPHCLFSELEKFIEQEKGLETHEWEMKLILDENWGIKPDHPKYGKLAPQALNAIEQNEIYLWWKANKDKSDSCNDDYEKEEQEMLIRLVKIYRSLWT